MTYFDFRGLFYSSEFYTITLYNFVVPTCSVW